jgi:hypothetical protein
LQIIDLVHINAVGGIGHDLQQAAIKQSSRSAVLLNETCACVLAGTSMLASTKRWLTFVSGANDTRCT